MGLFVPSRPTQHQTHFEVLHLPSTYATTSQPLMWQRKHRTAKQQSGPTWFLRPHIL